LLIVALPVPIATLVLPKAMVKVGPPLFCNGPRLSAALVVVVVPVRVPLVIKLLVDDEVGAVPEKSGLFVLVLLAIMLLVKLRVLSKLRMPPPWLFAELLAMVELEMLRVPESLKMPPPWLVALLLAMVELEMVLLPRL